MFSNDFTPKNADFFVCEKCHFKCSKKSEWNRHIQTHKHKINDLSIFSNDFTPKSAKKNAEFFICEICDFKCSKQSLV